MQEQFDKIAKHLLTQGRKAKDSDGNCVYRSASGLKCALGCLISDELYSPSMENKDWNDICRTWPELNSAIYPLLAWDLQRLHDCYPVYYWASQLRKIAAKYNLQYNEDLYHS